MLRAPERIGAQPRRPLCGVFLAAALLAGSGGSAGATESVVRSPSTGSDLRKEAIAAAAKVQAQEDRLTELEVQYRALDRRRRDQRRALRANQDSLISTLGALSRMARRPPQLLLFDQRTTTDTWRSAALLGKALPVMRTRGQTIGKRISALRGLADDITAEKAALHAARQTLLARRAELDRLVVKTAHAKPPRTAAEIKRSERTGKLAGKAKDITGLMTRLARTAPDAATGPVNGDDAADPQRSANLLPNTTLNGVKPDFGQLPMPARGRLTGRFGGTDDSGRRSKGLTLRTRHGAAVIAPSDGEVMFAGPFRGYGQLLIISMGKGYHMLLAGLSRIDVSVGQWLLAGEPVGAMSQQTKEIVDGRRPRLYIELRRNGNPINPLPWIAAGKRKVSG